MLFRQQLLYTLLLHYILLYTNCYVDWWWIFKQIRRLYGLHFNYSNKIKLYVFVFSFTQLLKFKSFISLLNYIWKSLLLLICWWKILSLIWLRVCVFSSIVLPKRLYTFLLIYNQNFIQIFYKFYKRSKRWLKNNQMKRAWISILFLWAGLLKV